MTDEVMTLHELCDAFGISRRTVQGYEKHGLVRATGRNPRGYLLYDLQMQAEIQKVHQFQKFWISGERNRNADDVIKAGAAGTACGTADHTGAERRGVG